MLVVGLIINYYRGIYYELGLPRSLIISKKFHLFNFFSLYNLLIVYKGRRRHRFCKTLQSIGVHP